MPRARAASRAVKQSYRAQALEILDRLLIDWAKARRQDAAGSTAGKSRRHTRGWPSRWREADPERVGGPDGGPMILTVRWGAQIRSTPLCRCRPIQYRRNRRRAGQMTAASKLLTFHRPSTDERRQASSQGRSRSNARSSSCIRRWAFMLSATRCQARVAFEDPATTSTSMCTARTPRRWSPRSRRERTETGLPAREMDGRLRLAVPAPESCRPAGRCSLAGMGELCLSGGELVPARAMHAGLFGTRRVEMGTLQIPQRSPQFTVAEREPATGE